MKQQNLERFTEEIQGPYELPEGWRWVNLGEVVLMRKQTIDPKNYPDEEFELYSIPAYHEVELPEIKKGSEIGSSKFQVKPQDILFGKLNPHIPKVWRVITYSEKRQIATTEFFPIYPKNHNTLLNDYLFWSLKAPQFLDHVIKLVIGTTGSRKRLQKGDFLNLKIPLPPLEEQKRIVARIEQLFSKIDEVKKLRKEALEEARALLPSALHQVFSKADEKGWKWVRLGEICNVFSGSSAPQGNKYFEGGNYPFVRVQDLGKFGRTDNLVDTADKINDLAVKKFRLVKAQKGTIVFPKSGAAILTNNRGILGMDAFIVSHLAAVQPLNNLAISKFVYYWLCQIDMVNYIENPAYPSLKLSTIKNLQIPLPPLEEQKRIVAYLDKVQEKALALQKLQEETEKEIEKLREAILHKAFTGGL